MFFKNIIKKFFPEKETNNIIENKKTIINKSVIIGLKKKESRNGK
jgi:hypothetical protein